MDMYRIVFSGELIEGFHAPDVRQAALMRFKLGDGQVQRMFSGERAVLKKAVSHEAAQPYMAELARMGMQVRLEALQQFDDVSTSELKFKVVFWGRTLAGFTRDQVMRAVPRRLPLEPAQVIHLFAGGKAVLKRGVSAEVGARYIAELARIGMQVELEIEQDSLSQAARAFNPTASQIAAEDQSYSSFMQTQIDLQQAGNPLDTNIMGMAAQREAELAPPPIPPKTVSAANPATASAAPVAQRTERLASAIEAAYVAELGPTDNVKPAKPELRCAQCGHRQSSGARCSGCGCEFPRSSSSASKTVREELTRSLHDEMLGLRVPGENLATLMREMRAQEPGAQQQRSRRLRAPILVGGAACLAAVGGWFLLSHH